MNAALPSIWLAPYHKSNGRARIRLFCFPYAGGSASVFVRWGSLLPPDIDVCPIQLPGRENRLGEACYASVTQTADAAAQGLEPYFDMPFSFFGHSLGALVAYELCQTLQRLGKGGPQHLIVSAHRAPHVALPHEPTWQLDEAQFKSRLQELNGTPKEVFQHPELLALVLPLLRSDFRLDETYTHGIDRPLLNCPITVVGGRQDSEIPESDLQAWGVVTRGRFELKMIDGDHFFIHTSLTKVAELVNQIMQRRR
jgi:surfactin synthase thioesterase subunit